jgi:single-strand DNA-binding protein
MFNQVQLIGRLGADPDVRFLADGSPVANFRIATDEKVKTKAGETITRTEWHKVVMFGRMASVANDWLRKGRLIFVQGRIQTREYTDQNEIRRFVTEVVANNMKMMPDGKQPQTQAAPPPPAEVPADCVPDDEIPF